RLLEVEVVADPEVEIELVVAVEGTRHARHLGGVRRGGHAKGDRAEDRQDGQEAAQFPHREHLRRGRCTLPARGRQRQYSWAEAGGRGGDYRSYFGRSASVGAPI